MIALQQAFLHLSLGAQLLVAAAAFVSVFAFFALGSVIAVCVREMRADNQQHSITSDDPMNPEPRRIQEILFEDGFRFTASEIYARGLLPIVDCDGRVVMVADVERKTTTVVEDWCGLNHGARIT
jgi:hypothetical protein